METFDPILFFFFKTYRKNKHKFDTNRPSPTPRLKDDAFGSPSNFDLNEVNRDQWLNHKVHSVEKPFVGVEAVVEHGGWAEAAGVFTRQQAGVSKIWLGFEFWAIRCWAVDLGFILFFILVLGMGRANWAYYNIQFTHVIIFHFINNVAIHIVAI
ncbi:uncharacterized protein [Gossypium hirsutum]|uniref:Uncharacterized protein n=1 Tax=Gossypium hirsutum TaxID=3635 RepID=A0A1U8J7D7_GOSHI|nr:uncharacterized protein LOC107904393 [Gossypium hirsutum]